LAAHNEHEESSIPDSGSISLSLGCIQLCSRLSLYPLGGPGGRIRICDTQAMTQESFFTLYFASLGIIGGLAGYVITHLLSEIKRLNTRVDEIYNILLDR